MCNLLSEDDGEVIPDRVASREEHVPVVVEIVLLGRQQGGKD